MSLPDHLSIGVAELARRDSRLHRVLDAVGAPPPWERPPGFPTLVLFILEQQVSLASARAAFRRLEESLDEITPSSIIGAPDPVLRDAGVSRQKNRYIRNLADAVMDGSLDLHGLSRMPDDQAVVALTAITGIGRWTAEVYLLACLQRPDVWPVGDRALQVSAAEVLELDEVPGPDALREIGETWRPHRSTAARILWHAYLTRRGRGNAPV